MRLTNESTWRAVTAALITMTGLIALTACGGGDDGASAGTEKSGNKKSQASAAAWTYQFDEVKVANQGDAEPATAESDPFTVTLSDELVKAKPEVGNLAVRSYQVDTKALPSGLCRADVTVDFAPDGAEALTKDDGAEGALDDMTGDSSGEVVSSLPSDDDVDSSGGAYITEDASKFAIIDDCSSSDDDDFMRLNFPFAESLKEKGKPDYDAVKESDLAYTDIVLVAGGQSGSEGSTTLLRGRTMLDVSAGGTWRKSSTQWEVDPD